MARLPAAMAMSEGLPGRKRDQGRLWADVLQDVPLFAGVSKRHIRKIASLTREARFRPATVIVREGRPGRDFYVILDGNASVVRPHGLPGIRLGPGSYFGELALIDGGARTASVVADTDVHCLRLSRASFMRMLRGEPEVAVALLRHLASRIRELQGQAQLTA